MLDMLLTRICDTVLVTEKELSLDVARQIKSNHFAKNMKTDYHDNLCNEGSVDHMFAHFVISTYTCIGGQCALKKMSAVMISFIDCLS